MTIRDIIDKTNALIGHNPRNIIVNGIIKNGFTENAINTEVKDYRLDFRYAIPHIYIYTKD